MNSQKQLHHIFIDKDSFKETEPRGSGRFLSNSCSAYLFVSFTMTEMSFCVKKGLNTFIGLDPTISTFIPKFFSFAAIVFAGTTAACCRFTGMVFPESTLMILCLQSAHPSLAKTPLKVC